MKYLNNSHVDEYIKYTDVQKKKLNFPGQNLNLGLVQNKTCFDCGRHLHCSKTSKDCRTKFCTRNTYMYLYCNSMICENFNKKIQSKSTLSRHMVKVNGLYALI